jgi:hypothetical protein
MDVAQAISSARNFGATSNSGTTGATAVVP